MKPGRVLLLCALLFASASTLAAPDETALGNIHTAAGEVGFTMGEPVSLGSGFVDSLTKKARR